MKNETIKRQVREVLKAHPYGEKLSKQFGIELAEKNAEKSSGQSLAKAANLTDIDTPLLLIKELEASRNGDRVEALVQVGLSGSRSEVDPDTLRSLMYQKPTQIREEDDSSELKKAG